ncbi:MAG: protein-disulfide reductase DsbD [Proteobacteria bacterium]|nr:protein-disulfide reductase DsbD [Pseudomonadota bacterium]MDA0992695.1 protein-disulfide reductase DsbD [Pseudomonadota bacterium]
MTTRLKNARLLILLCLPLLTQFASAQDDEILHPEEAYRYAAADTGSAIEIDWVVEDGYYLYRGKMSYASGSDSIVLGDYVLPEGEHHEDEFFGVQPVYRNRFFVSIPYTVVGAAPLAMELVIKSQGCADIGICYPPQTWTESIKLVARNDLPGKIDLGNSFGTFGGANSDFLPVDEVFQPILTAIDGNNVEVAIRVTDGYYLYRDKISASVISDSAQAGLLELPAGEKKTDQYFGEMEVYHGDVFGKLAIARATPEAMKLDVELKYQGCADGGICYPPITRVIQVSLPEATAISALSAVSAASPRAPISEQGRLAQVITTSAMGSVVATFFGLGLLLAFTPCVLPMVPILSGIIAGDGDKTSSSRGFWLALSYVMGMALVYTAAGVAAAAAGLQLQAMFNQPWVLVGFSSLFVILALSMFGMFDLQMPSAIQTRMANASGNQKRGTAIGAFVMGALSSLVVTACVAPALIATLTVMAQTGDMLRGGTALFAMSLGMGAPLLLVGAAQGKYLPKAGAWMVAVKNAFGFMMLGMGIWMMSRILPGEVTLAAYGILIFMAGVYLGGLTQLTPDSLGTRKLGKGLGLLAIIYGAVLLVGSLAGSNSMLRPLAALNSGIGTTGVAQHSGLDFQRIKTTGDLDAALARASADGKSAMLDFYADWCVSCIEMEEYTFTDSGVQDSLSGTVLLQADVTANDDEDQALLKRFGVFGPPTIIFFGNDGTQRHGYEVVGYMKAKDFAEHVRMATGNNADLSAKN